MQFSQSFHQLLFLERSVLEAGTSVLYEIQFFLSFSHCSYFLNVGCPEATAEVFSLFQTCDLMVVPDQPAAFSTRPLSTYFHTQQQDKRDLSLTKSGMSYLCTLHILLWAWVFYRPGISRPAHPLRRSRQYIDGRKRLLSDLWRSCAHLIIPLK